MKKILLFLILLLSFESVSATNVVTLGDSIPAGYGLSSEEDSFVNLLQHELNFNLKDYSVTGMYTDDLIDELSTHKLDEDIINANIITISIGSNDFLIIAEEIFELISEKAIDIESPSLEEIKEMLNYLNVVITEPRITNEVNEAIHKFKNNWNTIIEYIYNLNSDAKIIVTNVYNPFFDLKIPLNVDLTAFYNYFEESILEINEIISSYDKYEIVDLYTILRNNNLTNVIPIKFSFDPHPNKKGHQRIYEAFLDKLAYEVVVEGDTNKIYHVMKGDKLVLEPEEKDGYSFERWNQDLDKIDSNITVKPIYKRNINYILPIVIFGILAISVLIIFIVKKKS